MVSIEHFRVFLAVSIFWPDIRLEQLDDFRRIPDTTIISVVEHYSIFGSDVFWDKHHHFQHEPYIRCLQDSGS